MTPKKLIVIAALAGVACNEGGRDGSSAPATPSVLTASRLHSDSLPVPDADGWIYFPRRPGSVEYSRRTMRGRKLADGCELGDSGTFAAGHRTEWETAINVRTCEYIWVTGELAEMPLPPGTVGDTVVDTVITDSTSK